MKNKHLILISLAVCSLFSLLFFIVFSEHGLIDLKRLKVEKSSLIQQNQTINQENIGLSAEIERLKKDLNYIETIARQDLGMVAADEIIIKPQ
jgi:cell division protein FtsB